jgi:rhodanese-related sulfurtransferase
MDHKPGFLKVVSDARSRVNEVDIEGYRRLAAGANPPLLIDVREDKEFEAGHAKDAQHIGKGVIERDIETRVPDLNTPMVLYCGGGFRSAIAADALQKMGYTNVISLDGGWRAYTSAGLPVSSGSSQSE